MFDLTSDQRALRLKARDLAEGHVAARAAEVDQTEEYPWDTVELLNEAGFMGMTVPQAHGGQGRGFLDAVLVIAEMAKHCGVTARIVVEANMGAISAVMKYGSEAQKEWAAGYVLAGDKPAICITEPDAGSAAAEMTTRADKQGDVYVLNGVKHWITGGGVSKLHLIFARVFEDGVEQGIGGFLCARNSHKGLVIGKRTPAMGLRGIPETQVHFENLEIPADMALIPPEGVKRGFAGLMNAYNSQRVGAATVALGIAQGAYERAMEYTQEREQFGRPIAEFQGLQWMLADMATQTAAAETLIWRAADSAARTDAGFPDPLLAAQAKIFASEMAIKVTSDALQLWGAAGYSRENPMERMYRDARMFTIGGGTAQVLRTLVASRVLGRKLPQTRDGYTKLAGKEAVERVRKGA